MGRKKGTPELPTVDEHQELMHRKVEETMLAPRALADSERLYRALFEGMASAVTIRSLEDQSFIDCNPAALKLYRAASVEQLRGTKVTVLSAETQSDGTPTLEALRRHVALAVQNGTQRSEWLARRIDGSVFVADIHTAIVELEGGRRVMQTIVEDITERKNAEAALERRARRDEVVARISRYFLEPDVEAAAGFAAQSLGDFLGVSAATVFEWFRAPPSPGDVVAWGDEAAVVLLVGEMVALARARADAEDALRSGEQRYRSLVERSHDAIFTFDPQGKIIFASPAAEQILGYSVEEWPGMAVTDVVVPDELAAVNEVIAAARVGIAGPPREWTVRHKNGSLVRIESARSPIRDKHGAVVGTQIIVRDISERHRAEQMREAAALELNRAREDAVAASRAKSAFVANMSHELRTPLNGVIGMVDLLSGTSLDARQKRYVEVARSSASLLLSVINDILDFSKIEAGKLELERIEFSFGDVMEEVATMMELAAEDKGLELTCHTDTALPSTLVGDPVRIRQVLVNLISNAVKFTSFGEIGVRATLGREASDRSYVRVDVRDTGVGISEDSQRKLFQAFSQVDATTTRKHGGTGLGLAICRELVHRMGGTIGVESTAGGGSTFWFTLNLEHPVEPRERMPLIDARLAGLRVLAVDDNVTNRELLRAQLAAAGMRCDVAASGEEALRMLAAAAEEEAPFPLAVLDQQMPEMDGLELTRRIKADARIARTRLVMLGSIGRPLDPRQLRALGVLTWATKPIWRAHLLGALRAALEDEGVGTPGHGEPQEARELVPQARNASRTHILLVEDTPINAEVVSEILRTAGYAVELAVDGLQAVEAAGRGIFDLILMDCQLPGIDGYEATRRIRLLESSRAVAGGRPRRVPILALTASAAVEDMDRARGAGMDGHIAKPVDARRLLAAIVEHESSVGERAADAGVARTNQVVNLSRALDRLLGNRKLLDLIVDQFRGEADRMKHSACDALEQRDIGAIGYAAHRLRGQALALDAHHLAGALEALEVAVAGGEWNEIAAAQRTVEREIGRVIAELGPA